jgi:hypothetical protein
LMVCRRASVQRGHHLEGRWNSPHATLPASKPGAGPNAGNGRQGRRRGPVVPGEAGGPVA